MRAVKNDMLLLLVLLLKNTSSVRIISSSDMYRTQLIEWSTSISVIQVLFKLHLTMRGIEAFCPPNYSHDSPTEIDR